MKKNMKQLSLSMIFTSLLFCGHFTPAYLEFSDNPYNAMTIAITSAQIDGIDLVAGDEVGIFDGQLCVGSGTVTETITTNARLEIRTSANDANETTVNGFVAGNSVIYRIWDASEAKEGTIASTGVTYLQGEGLFSDLGSAYASLTGAATDLALEDMSYPENFQLQSIYPNPFNPTTNITYELAENSNVKMEIYDLSGKLISSLVNEFQPAGLHSISWNAMSQSSGIYLVQLTTNNNMETQKITCIK